MDPEPTRIDEGIWRCAKWGPRVTGYRMMGDEGSGPSDGEDTGLVMLGGRYTNLAKGKWAGS